MSEKLNKLTDKLYNKHKKENNEIMAGMRE
jgi:hypothetical protein